MTEPSSPETVWRGPAGNVIILLATCLALGLTLRMPTMIGANDISRWCTVWSLVERGTYTIDDCPWQADTQDKVFRPNPWEDATPGQTAPKHFYSSKPPMLPTLIAAGLYPFRQLSGLPLDHQSASPRIPRNVIVDDPKATGGKRTEMQTPEPFKWSLHVVYFKPVVVLLNILPLALILVRYRRYLDDGDSPDWAWLASLSAFSFGTYLTVFTSTLNNHLVAAWAAFFAFGAMIRAVNDTCHRTGPYLQAGFFSAFCACNELPAASLPAIIGLVLASVSFRRTLTSFLPAAMVPTVIFFACQYAALGTFKPAYADFGGDAYEYAGSYWTTPLDLDYFDKHPEPRIVYLGHMLFGHHGIFSLSPVFLFAMGGIASRMGSRFYRAVALLMACLGIAGAACAYRIYNYQTIDPAALTWLFLLIPLWLMLIPQAIDPRTNPGKATGAWVTMILSVVVVGF
ncbi:MAG: hypothetical protein ACKO5E_06535, partial [bacterium]